MESQPQNPEFRNNPEKFHLCISMNYIPLQTCLIPAISMLFLMEDSVKSDPLLHCF